MTQLGLFSPAASPTPPVKAGDAWTSPSGRTWRVSLVDAGSLVEVLGIQLRDEWSGPRGESFRVTGLNTESDRIELGRGAVTGSAVLLLELGWRPGAGQ